MILFFLPMEHTDKTQQENPDTPQASETKNNPKLYLRRCTTWIRNLHPAWYIVVGLLFLIMSIIVYYEHREERSWWGGYHRYERQHMPHMELIPWFVPRIHMDLDREFERMDRDIEHMRSQMEKRMSEVRWGDMLWSEGSYHWSRIEWDSSYTIQARTMSGVTEGTITGTNSGKINTIKEMLKKEWANTSETNGVMSFSGNTNIIRTIESLLR